MILVTVHHVAPRKGAWIETLALTTKPTKMNFYWPKARTIGEALEVGNKILAKIAAEVGWKQWMIWNVGIAYGDDNPMGMF